MTIDPNTEGKNAVITGGSKGIGLAAALELLRRGSNVAVVARTFSEEVRTELEHTGCGKCYFLTADLSRPKERVKLIERAADCLGGPIDILFNNAGGVTDGSITDISEEEYVRSRELLFDSAVDLMRQVLPLMYARNSGVIVNTASIFGLRSAEGCFTYSVFKHALISATENAARSAARHGVRINCIAPGTTRTGLTEGRGDFTGERYKKTVAQYPIGRLGTTEDIVNAFLFLISDASSFICGHTLVSDGGFLA